MRNAIAIIKELEIMGEAAAKLSENFRSQHKEIPWQIIIATRQHLVHGDFDVDLEIVWSTVSEDLPLLVKALKKLF